MNLKKLVTCCVSFLAVFFGEIAINVACGPEMDPYDYYVSYFHNNVQGDDYVPFSFSQMLYLYDRDEVVSEAEINSSEWATYLNVKKEDVLDVMYNTDSILAPKNSFISGLKINKAASKYYAFAKSCEPFAKSYYDSWDPIARDSSIIGKKGDEAIDLMKAENDKFLKLRYAYQAERMYYYAGNLEGSKNAYEKFIAPIQTRSAVKGWSLSFYAGAQRFTGSPAKSAYLFSKVFASNPERRVQAYRNYYYCGAALENVLEFAQNGDERAAILAISSFGNPAADVESLEKVYKNAPKSLLNGALLVREVNKLEEHLIKSKSIADNYYTGYFARSARYYGSKNKDSIADVYLKHLIKIKHFANKLAEDKQYPEPELGTLTSAYLSWMEHKDEQALILLASLNPTKLPEKLRDQYRITELLIKGNKIKRGNAFNEDELLPALKWLDEKRFAEHKSPPTDINYYDADWGNGRNRFTLTTRNFYQQVLAPAYLQMGDTAKAAMAMLKGDTKYRSSTAGTFTKNMSYQTLFFWQNSLGPKAMNDLATFKTGTNTNGLSKWLSEPLSKLNNDDFNELFGTVYLRSHQYAKALSCFNKLSASYTYYTPDEWYSGDNEKSYANTFIERVKDYPKEYGKVGPGINKKSFAREMLRLQKLTQSDKKNAASYYYKMANAIYQTGYYGNSWFFISYEWTSFNIYNEPRFVHDADFKLAKTAKAWYLKARLLSKNANLKAKCTFMLAKCEQKQLINSHYEKINWYQGDYEARYNKFIALNKRNPYFKEMKLNYTKTPFYKIAATECSYFADFLKTKK